MQTVLVLASQIAPVRELLAETPPDAEGAFLASFEAELPADAIVVAALAPVSPVAPVAPSAPQMPPLEKVTTDHATSATDGGGNSPAPLVDGASLASALPVVTDAEPAPLVRLGHEGLPDRVRVDLERPFSPGRDSAPVDGTPGPSKQGAAQRSSVADAAWAATRDRPQTQGAVSEVVRHAVMTRSDIGETAMAPAVGAIEPEGRNQTVFPAPMYPPLQTAGQSTPAPEAADVGGNVKVAASPADNTSLVPTGLANQGPVPMDLEPDQGGSGIMQPAPDHIPEAEMSAPQLPAVDSVDPAPAARAGLWESMFAGLALRTERPVRLPLPETAALLAAEPEDASSQENARGEEPVLSHSAPPIAASRSVDASRLIASPFDPSTAFRPQGTSWQAAGTDPEDEPAEDRLLSLVVPGSPSPASASIGPVASSSLPASPVTHAAAQMAAALSQSADGATELALSPEELGQVRLRLEADAADPDRMVVMITFERPETLDLFRRHAGELADALRAAGYAGADIGFGQDHSGSDDGAGDSRSTGSAPGRDQPEPVFPPPSAPRLAAGASLDLRL